MYSEVDEEHVLSIEDICLRKSLYEEVKIHENQVEDFYQQFHNFKRFDGYCVDCQRERHFRGNVHSLSSELFERTTNEDQTVTSIKDGCFYFDFKCPRDQSHKIIFHFEVKNSCLKKIGQSPSMADLQLFDVGKYKGYLPEDDFRELKKAIGLNAHGVGIGSFVYLRRIFERLIEKAHEEAKQSSEWDEENYSKSRMNEKINLLRNYLPDFLVDNRSIYSILSKGIHQLAEDECKNAFPVIKVGIELILDEKIEEENRKSKIEKASKDLSRLHQQYVE